MRTLLFVVIIFMLSVTNTSAQKKVALDSLGNYTTVMNVGGTASKDKETGKFFVDSKGIKYPVRCSINNKLYYLKTSRNGNVYKVYLLTK